MKKPLAALEASPYKSVAEELERLRKTFRVLNQRYTSRVEKEITALRDIVLAAAEEASPDHPTAPTASGVKKPRARPAGKPTALTEAQTDRFHDLRDMLTLLRTFEAGSEVAKRRDFKRVENLLEELQLLARRRA